MKSSDTDTSIYLDYQATTPLDPRVFEVMKDAFLKNFGNPHSNDHFLGWKADSAVEEARAQIAELISADPDEIVFTSGATEANNLAILGLAHTFSERRSKVLVSSIEHKCVLEASRQLRRHGFVVETIPVLRNGLVDLEFLSNAINDQTAIVSVMTVNNEVGTIQPISLIAEWCLRHGVVLHSDAAQALSVIEVDVNLAGIDMMSLSAHKAYGPKGIGALYIHRDVQKKLRPIIHGGGQERGLRSGTLPTPHCVGFGHACHLINIERAADIKRLSVLTASFWDGLTTAIPGIKLNGAPSDRHPGNLNLLFPNIEASDLLLKLQPHLAASTGAACSSGIPEPSHVLRAMGLSAEEAQRSVRFSLGRFTTEYDVFTAVRLITDAVNSAELVN